ncbi:16S rRNA (cytosine967-C5)-methyltransferase [Poseidonocella pacifica]|uniref:16S rRNA (Cytosine967-C5)-methyltransferase n=1 Tax=Poseidonocella pacifica TaxID=871651 RepID=A0A1I0XN81_9RHOB|nr:RsmB/NOP family class I SAM-dependent RNA methyltransferase [Poseidonocella pacifica]SFB01423.1 16S rRNA (cytosine967-C5)-methyltransferase [Poseidonocella pacifica]
MSQSEDQSEKRIAVDARTRAVDLLDLVLGEGRLLSDAIGSGLLERLAPDERARAQRLATETLRALERTDRMLARHLRKPPPLRIRNILRLGTLELAQGAAAHGVVNASVGIAGAGKRTAQLKGLVNAVLRKVAAEMPEGWEKLRTPRLPNWLRKPLVAAWGAPAVSGMEDAHFAGAPLDLTPKGGAAELAERLGGEVLSTGSVRLRGTVQVSALDGYEQGDWWVQDAAAALPVKLLAPKPGERVLDLCAAPGGKTLQAAAAGADVVAVDLSAARLVRLEENLARCHLSAQVVAEDGLSHTGKYDAILLDAPCSATGTIRRHPDLPHARDGAEIAGLIDLQAALLDHALSLLAPGGRLVFCTCSLLPDEGECQIDAALLRHPGLRVVPACGPEFESAWTTEEGGVRLRPDFWPERGGMDGFYMALLARD